MAARRRTKATFDSRVILIIALSILVPCALMMAWPTLQGRIDQWEEQRALVAADDAAQWDIVRAFLQHPSVRFGEPSLYFDSKGATLCPLEHPAPCDAYDFMLVERELPLVDPTYAAVPLELGSTLERLTLTRSYNADPRLSGVHFLASAEPDAFEQACTRTASPERLMLIRMSRAAMDTRSGRALALVQRRFCDNSGRYFVASFMRNGEAWKVAESDVAMRADSAR